MAEDKKSEPKGQETKRPPKTDASEPEDSERRLFTRHNTEVPLLCRRPGRHERGKSRLDDMSFGGLAFVSDERYEKGDTIEVAFPSIAPGQLLSCTVSWRREMKGQTSPRYAYGVQFSEEGLLFRARLVNKVCDIEAYRDNQFKRWGRRISSEQAASELAALQAFR